MNSRKTTKEQEVDHLIDQSDQASRSEKGERTLSLPARTKQWYIHHFTLKKMKTEAPDKLVFSS